MINLSRTAKSFGRPSSGIGEDPKEERARLSQDKVREVNDFLRRSLCVRPYLDVDGLRVKGKLLLSEGVGKLRDHQQDELLSVVRDCNHFDQQAVQEHNAGRIQVHGRQFVWQFVYFDKSLERFGHHWHLLTIATAEEC